MTDYRKLAHESFASETFSSKIFSSIVELPLFSKDLNPPIPLRYLQKVTCQILGRWGRARPCESRMKMTGMKNLGCKNLGWKRLGCKLPVATFLPIRVSNLDGKVTHSCFWVPSNTGRLWHCTLGQLTSQISPKMYQGSKSVILPFGSRLQHCCLGQLTSAQL